MAANSKAGPVIKITELIFGYRIIFRYGQRTKYLLKKLFLLLCMKER